MFSCLTAVPSSIFLIIHLDFDVQDNADLGQDLVIILGVLLSALIGIVRVSVRDPADADTYVRDLLHKSPVGLIPYVCSFGGMVILVVCEWLFGHNENKRKLKND